MHAYVCLSVCTCCCNIGAHVPMHILYVYLSVHTVAIQECLYMYLCVDLSVRTVAM